MTKTIYLAIEVDNNFNQQELMVQRCYWRDGKINFSSVYYRILPAQEPVAWLSKGGDVSRSKKYFEDMGFTESTPLYAAPIEPVEFCDISGHEIGK